MNQNRLMTVLRAPVISEEKRWSPENEQVVFEGGKTPSLKPRPPLNCCSRCKSKPRCSTVPKGR